MNIQPGEVSIRHFYDAMVAVITPRPIAWVSTVDASGGCNLAPYSFFNGVGVNPPTLMFCPVNKADGGPKDTLANVRGNGQFVVNIVTESFAEAMKQSADDSEPEFDEFELTGMQKVASRFVQPPRVADVVAAIECELLTAMQLGVGPGGANLVVGRILSIYVRDDLVGEDGKPVPARFDTIGRMGGPTYSKTNDRFE